MALGIVLGTIKNSLFGAGVVMNYHQFFLYLLPPIVFEAGYFMPKTHFVEHLETILTFSIFGTLANAILLAIVLFIMPSFQHIGALNLQTWMVFSAALSAVDPVAVITTFDELHVNFHLYICIFGESLLNDAVAVAMFRVFSSEDQVTSTDFVLSFLYMGIGGIVLGFIFGCFVAWITKYTSKIQLFEPIVVICISYLAYLAAELLAMSSIMAVVVAGFTMQIYTDQNMTERAHHTFVHTIKSVSTIAEILIFIKLGETTASRNLWIYFDTKLAVTVLIAVTIIRFITTFGFGYLVNKLPKSFHERLSFVDKFMMSYSGLRGAVAFSLIKSLPESKYLEFETLQVFIVTTIVTVLFTTVIQGSTIGPLVSFLQIQLENSNESSKKVDLDTNYKLSYSEEVVDITECIFKKCFLDFLNLNCWF